jgi:hypothetical protein
MSDVKVKQCRDGVSFYFEYTGGILSSIFREIRKNAVSFFNKKKLDIGLTQEIKEVSSTLLKSNACW